jgi:hypothetical protein
MWCSCRRLCCKLCTDRTGHHRAYDIEMRVSCCEFEAMESRTQRYLFRMADCAAIVNELEWITGELSCLKNKKTKAAKRSNANKKRFLEDETIDDCEREQLRGEFLSLRSANAW